ncbi:MAG: lamin tail domain-containing protein [Candidatus Melainabacteria bacterium]|nr:lamin tail domain-containing protein [Candidatus Melainabacteria bacterium]
MPSALTVLEFEQTQIKVNAILSSEAIVDVTQLATYKIIAGDDVISINNSGFLTPIMNGNATVQVEYEGISSKLSVDVNIQSSVMAGDIIINEVLAAPEKDVNGDGVFDSTDDEFIEIVNISNDSLDIGGLVVSDKTKVRHVIPLGTILESFHSLVIFGGGDVSNSSSNFLIHIASVGDLGLNNSGVEQVTVQNPNGEIIDIVEFNSSGIKGVSLNREVDLEFSNLVSHDNLSTENYSPGRRVDLSPFF